jgi:phage N-6-adenine-methyltransferase
MDNVHYSSESTTWETPDSVFQPLNERYQFVLDVCASEINHKCDHYFSVADDGLSKEWVGNCWMNPPYGRGVIDKWVKKATESPRAVVVCLLPARTDTAWWQDYVMQGDITFIRGRIKFVGAKHGAPFPSAVVVL